MKIMSMHVENFLSFGTADFDFQDAGLVLVEGSNHDDDSARSNGSGKSAMVDAVLWCLFGTTLRGYEHDQVVHRRVGQDCVVQVFLRDRDGGWNVTRARRHKRLKNSLVVADESGSGFVHASDKDAQAEITRRLGCTFRTFLSSVVFGQDRAYRFGSLTDAEQKAVLDDVLGVERFADACAVARRHAAALQTELAALRRGFERAEAGRAEAEAEVTSLEEQDQSFAASQREKVEAEREKLREVKAQVNRARKHHDVDRLGEAVSEATTELQRRDRELEAATRTLTQAEARAQAIGCRRDDLDAKIKHLRGQSGDCPTCGQEIDVKACARATEELRAERRSMKEEHLQASRAETDAVDACTEAKRHVAAAREVLQDAQKRLAAGIVAESDAATWRRRESDYRTRVAELEVEVNPYAALVEKARVRLTRHAREVDDLTHAIAVAEASVARAEWWVKAFGNRGLRSLMIDSSLPLLNDEAARASAAVTGGSISIEFSATSEQKSGKVVDRFEVRVDNRHGAGSYAGCSAGERAKVDLCVGLALQRLVASRSSASFNVAFYDEVFDHLDSAAHERVVEVLAGLDKESVYVVSHDEDLKAWFPATLRIVKRDGFSRVES